MSTPARFPRAVAAATVTTRPGIQAMAARPGRRGREIIHAVLETPLTLTARGPLHGVTLEPGAALCAEEGGPFPLPPAGLFDPAVTCPHCILAARAENIVIAGDAL
jgi:hypothetical protein